MYTIYEFVDLQCLKKRAPGQRASGNYRDTDRNMTSSLIARFIKCYSLSHLTMGPNGKISYLCRLSKGMCSQHYPSLNNNTLQSGSYPAWILVTLFFYKHLQHCNHWLTKQSLVFHVIYQQFSICVQYPRPEIT